MNEKNIDDLDIETQHKVAVVLRVLKNNYGIDLVLIDCLLNPDQKDYWRYYCILRGPGFFTCMATDVLANMSGPFNESKYIWENERMGTSLYNRYIINKELYKQFELERTMACR